MAYGIWLYKTIETQHGDVTLYIKKRNYIGEAIEINALAPDSLTLSIDGDKLTDPIIGSTLTFGIIDTEQIDTTQFFTPDATLYAVELYRGGTLEWSGYLTPDSYQENLSYRDTISLVARDNLGRLEEFKIEKHQGLQNIEILIDSFLAEVGCPQVLNWQCDKVATEKGEGVEIDTPIRDMWVNTRLWIGKTYRDAVEDILKGLGCQMRFAGNNNLVIVSISDFAEFANQSAIFINKSGHKEIIPAWRDATIIQDYGLIENFFDGQIKESDMGAKTYFIPYEVANGWYNTSSRGADIYFANQWMWKNNIEDDQSDSLYPVAKSGGGMASWGVMVNSTNSILTLKMKINNTLRRLANLVFDSTSNLHVGGDNLPSYSLVYQFKIQLKKADGTIYDMTKGGWETSSPSVITFAAEECNYNDEGTWNKDIDVSITINSIPFDGELLIGIGSVMYEGYPDDIVYFGKIKDITLSFNNDIGQKSSRVQIDTKHNINGEVQVNVGQVPRGKGDHLAYAGGLFAADGEPLSFFKRKTNDILAYNLLELVGRENIHLQKRNFAALSGEMTAKDTTITLGANIAYKGKYYALISASLNVLRNTLSVTRMQEVEDYQIAELTIIDSPLESSQGNKVGSGNSEVIQFSDDAGNAKRLYELQDATEQDQDGAYIIIDKSSMDSAKKLPISAISSALNKAFKVHYNSDGTIKSIEALANFWTNFGITAGGEGTGTGGGGGGGLTSFSVIVNNKTYNSDNGVATITEQLQPKITAANPLPYALVSGTPTLGSLAYKNSLAASDVPNLDWSKITSGKPTTLSGYGITDALPLSGGTISNSNWGSQLTLNGDGTDAGLKFTNSGNFRGLLYTNNDGRLGWYDMSGADHAILHSGNYSDYTVPINLSIPFASAVNAYGYGYVSGGWATSGAALIVGANSLYRMSIQGESNNTLLYRYCYNGTWGDVRYFAFTDSNVASATKLQTARTIWGQSFDGTGNVDGNIAINSDAVLERKSSAVWLNYGPANKNENLYLFGYNTQLYYGTASGYRLAIDIKPTGNVLIGTTADSAAKLRIQTNRTDTFTWNLGNLANKSDMALEFYDSYNSNIYGLYTAINYYSGDVAMQVGRSDGLTNAYNLCLQPLGGNVLIGTTTDSGTAKLQVNGKIKAPAINAGSFYIGAAYDGNSEVGYDCIERDIYGASIYMQYYNNGGISMCNGGGTVSMGGNLSVSGNIYASGAITAGTASDRRLKDNICTIDQNKAIEVLMSLNPITYEWNDKAKELGGYEGISQGFIAQEYESIIPNSGRAIWGEYRAIDYTKAIPYMVSVEQNHETRLQYLERENNELKQELQTLKREYYGVQ